MKAGEEFGIEPCGLGCRDTLRFEAMLPLYGHEISQDISPVEGGLNFFVKLDQEADFIGKEALKKIKEEKNRTLVGFEMIEFDVIIRGKAQKAKQISRKFLKDVK